MKVYQLASVIGLIVCGISLLFFVIGIATKQWIIQSASIELKELPEVMGTLMQSFGLQKNPMERKKRDLTEDSTISSGGATDLMGGLNLEEIQKMIGALMKDPKKIEEMLKMPGLTKMKVTVQLIASLTEACEKIKFSGGKMAKRLNQLKSQYSAYMTECIKYSNIKKMLDFVEQELSKENTLPGKVKSLLMGYISDEKSFIAAFDKTFNAIIVAIVFTALAVVISFLKTPCVKISRKNLLVGVTILLCVAAVIAGIVGVVLVSKNMWVEDEYNKGIKGVMRDMRSSPEEYGLPKNAAVYIDLAEKVHRIIKVEEYQGFSFMLCCGGIGLLFVVMLLNILEIMSGGKEAEDEYKFGLIVDSDYKMAERT